MKVLRLLAAAAAILAVSPATAGDSSTETDSKGNIWSFDYTTSAGNKAAITGVTLGDSAKKNGTLHIPSKLTSGGETLTVTEIRDGAFDGMNLIRTVYLPDSIKTITSEAFWNMNGNVEVLATLTPELRKGLRDGRYGTTRLTVRFYGSIPGLALLYPDCSKAQTLRGTLNDIASLDTIGAVEIKLGKAGKGTDLRPVKATISFTALNGKTKKKWKTTLLMDKNLCAKPQSPDLQFSMKDLPEDKLYPQITSDGEFLLDGVTLQLMDCGLGGALNAEYGGLHFSVGFGGKYPEPETGWTLLKDALPTSFGHSDVVKVVNGGKKFTTPKATKYKFKKSTNTPPQLIAMDGNTVLDKVMDGVNRAGVKITYNAKTGQFKGSFSIYFINEAKAKIKSVKVKFSGFIFRYGPQGIGITTDKKYGPWEVWMSDGLG